MLDLAVKVVSPHVHFHYTGTFIVQMPAVLHVRFGYIGSFLLFWMISIQDDSYSFYRLSIDPFVKFLLLYFFNSKRLINYQI